MCVFVSVYYICIVCGCVGSVGGPFFLPSLRCSPSQAAHRYGGGEGGVQTINQPTNYRPIKLISILKPNQ